MMKEILLFCVLNTVSDNGNPPVPAFSKIWARVVDFMDTMKLIIIIIITRLVFAARCR